MCHLDVGGHALVAEDGRRRRQKVGVEPVDGPVRRVHEDEGVDEFGALEHEDLSDHAPHRVAQQDTVRPSEGVRQDGQVGRQHAEAVGGLVVGRLTLAVAPQVGRHRPPPALGQWVEPVGEVLLGAAVAMHEHESSRRSRAGLRHRQRDVTDADPAGLHQAPLLARCNSAPRSVTWSGGGTFTTTGTPKSYSSMVASIAPVGAVVWFGRCIFDRS